MEVSDEPDRFPADLLTQPAGTRQEYFEQQCLIEHPHLLKVLDHIVQTVCPPGEGASKAKGAIIDEDLTTDSSQPPIPPPPPSQQSS